MSELAVIQLSALWPGHGRLRYQLQFDEASPSNNTIKGMHFHVYKKTREEWMRRVQQEVARQEKLPFPIEKAFLVVTRECCGGGLDWDNIYGGMKPLLDCLVAPSARNPSGLGLIADDNPRNMPYPPFIRQLPAKKNAGRTTLEIYELVD